jgi:hypothetical protein
MSEKARYWVGICWTENMFSDWEDRISDLVQVPFAYCIHDKDLTEVGEQRKKHVHIILAFPNTTTYNHALSVFNELSVDQFVSCCNTCKRIINVRHMYEYLIHNTEQAKKVGKYQYPADERIEGNKFDIGCFEQVGIEEKNEIIRELSMLIVEQQFTNYYDFYFFVLNNYSDTVYFDVIKGYTSLFSNLTKGLYQKLHSDLNKTVKEYQATVDHLSRQVATLKRENDSLKSS